ncbi:hypothetical protein THRCLA_07452 [Thraustotheca clavata]|uniref:Ankyrin repeat n=1 Tax=Thraustotheca clavata TaxID=74557 RepID=A0A1V9ZDE7_9STRA|nr:hypothetical protein THRCLA_07452 [Thraustotheca clavata]
MEAVRTVLRCTDLVQEIVEYQPGLHLSVYSFQPFLQRSYLQDHDFPDDTEWGYHHAIAIEVNDAISPWFHDHGVAGVLHLLQWKLLTYVQGVYYWAVAGCDLDVVKEINVLYHDYAPRGLIDVASARGDIELLAWLHTNGHRKCSSNAMDMAADRGFYDVVTYLRAMDCDGATVAGFEAAVQHGYLDIVRYLYEQYPAICRSNIYEIAAAYGQLDVLRYLCRYTAPFDVSIQRAKFTAAQTNQFDILLELHRLYSHDQHLLSIARYALKRHCVPLCECFTTSIWPELSSLTEHLGKSCVVSSIIDAARAGCIDILLLLHQHEPDLVWPTDAMEAAAEAGHLDTVKFLHENHPETDSEMALYNAITGQRADMDLIIYLVEVVGIAGDPHLAVLHNRLDALEYFNSSSIVAADAWTPELMDLAAAHGKLDLVKFFHYKRKEGCTSAAMNLAAGFGHLDIVVFLNENRQEGCTDAALEKAMTRRNKGVVEYLFTKCRRYFTRPTVLHAKQYLRRQSNWDHRKVSFGEIVC